MIHPDAARAVGRVEINGAFEGHCVLVAARQAVTCAHVLSKKPAKPGGAVRLVFPRLDFEVRASVAAWHPFDPDLSRGSDIALLTWDAPALEHAWAKLDTLRPVANTEVVAWEYQTSGAGGDPREATIRYADEARLILGGHRLIDAGMSGTGLFHREPGERLVGLVAWKPKVEGQTAAFAIPADEIRALQAEAAEGSVKDLPRALFDGLTEAFLAQVGDNYRPILQDFVAAAAAVLTKPAEAWTECDIYDLTSLFGEIHSETGGKGIPLPPGLSQAMARLAALTSELVLDPTSHAETVPLTPEMARELEAVQRDLEAFERSSMCPDPARQPLAALLRQIASALYRKYLAPRRISDGNALVQREAGEAYRGLNRTLPFLLGQRADLLPAGTIFVDSLESWAPEMVVIPTGSFLMGSPENESDRLDNEGPQHAVEIKTKFALARFSLTFEEFDAFCVATGRALPKDKGWGRERRPVIHVSWKDATEWCDWISVKSSARYRLPSEAEWEYACRAGSKTAFWFGEQITTKHYLGNALGMNSQSTLPADDPRFQSNAFGLSQMHGNVWEWCEDLWKNNYSEPRRQTPYFGDVAEEVNRIRVQRGGSWTYSPAKKWHRSATRLKDGETERNNDVGFRPARELLTLRP